MRITDVDEKCKRGGVFFAMLKNSRENCDEIVYELLGAAGSGLGKTWRFWWCSLKRVGLRDFNGVECHRIYLPKWPFSPVNQSLLPEDQL